MNYTYVYEIRGLGVRASNEADAFRTLKYTLEQAGFDVRSLDANILDSNDPELTGEDEDDLGDYEL